MLEVCDVFSALRGLLSWICWFVVGPCCSSGFMMDEDGRINRMGCWLACLGCWYFGLVSKRGIPQSVESKNDLNSV